MYDFYRKEDPRKFKERFSGEKDLWKLKSHIVFRAHLGSGATNKRNCIVINNTKYSISFVENSLHIEWDHNKSCNLNEKNIIDLLCEKKENSVNYQIIRKLCNNHANNSKNSPFISGCITPNFNDSYDGVNLHIKLTTRVPFENPFSSGTEREYFLVGEVKKNECEVYYCRKKTYKEEEIEIGKL